MTNGWGGKRPGAGRPTNPDKHLRVVVFLTEAERDKFKTLGGSKWLRSQLKIEESQSQGGEK